MTHCLVRVGRAGREPPRWASSRSDWGQGRPAGGTRQWARPAVQCRRGGVSAALMTEHAFQGSKRCGEAVVNYLT